ncbi:hypothetical protein LEP1GSC163_2791 [Leptospira santarosai str. CBC379]|nr:hypothetical protein LEP1GSC163_2791 [Leptospira santarosai str. CBC379]EMJ51620.1 hypothetical protein LEP1GSC169_1772 [Leptospira santarosai str. HAI1349]
MDLRFYQENKDSEVIFRFFVEISLFESSSLVICILIGFFQGRELRLLFQKTLHETVCRNG